MFTTGQITAVKRRLRVAIALILLLGIVFRFTNVSHKPYWHDEVFTTVRVVGYTGPEIEAAVLAQPLVRAADLQRFQTLPADRGWGDTFASLATHPEHPPLFYLLARAWIGVTGTTPTALRLLSVAFSLLSLPLMYLLGRSLFADGWTAGLATTLMALSPVQVLYAQEAREYSLWICLTLLSSLALLRALRLTGRQAVQRQLAQASRREHWGAWLVYAVSTALCFYTTILSGLVVAAQGLYVLAGGIRRQWVRFALSVVGAIALFSPWLWVIVSQNQKLESVTGWTTYSRPIGQLIQLWGLHLSSAVVDFGLPPGHWFGYVTPRLLLGLLLAALLQMPTQVGQRATMFCGLLLTIPALGLIMPDLLLGGQRSSATRYFMPSLLTVLLVLSVWLRGLLFARRTGLRRWGQTTLAIILAASLISCTLSASRFTWWNKGVSYHIPVIADIIRAADAPLILAALSANGLGNAISLSYQVPPETPFIFFRREQLPVLPSGYGRYFVPYASGELIEALQAEYGRSVNPVQQPGVFELWELGT
ncbi:MAG: glycosyltransferase family 39 protein [Cyanobacteria bacterium J06648_16]